MKPNVKKIFQKLGCVINTRKQKDQLIDDFFGDLSPRSQHNQRSSERAKESATNQDDGYDGYDEFDDFKSELNDRGRIDTNSNGSLSLRSTSGRSGTSRSGKSGRTTRSGKSGSGRSPRSACSINMAGSFSGFTGSSRQTEHIQNRRQQPQSSPPQMNIYIQKEPQHASFRAPVSSTSFAKNLLSDNILDSPPPTATTTTTNYDDTNAQDRNQTPVEKAKNPINSANANNIPASAALIQSKISKKEDIANGKRMNGKANTTASAASQMRNHKAKKGTTTSAESKTCSKRQNGSSKPVNNNESSSNTSSNISNSVPPPPPFSSVVKEVDENDKYRDLLISPLTAPTMAVKVQIPRVSRDHDFSVAPSLAVQKRSIVTVTKKYDTNGTGAPMSNGISSSKMSDKSSSGSSVEKRVTTNIVFDDIYERGKQLGFGAFANVFLATHKPTGAKYAVKEVDRTSMVWNDKDHLQHEIDNMFKVREGPNIVQLYEVYSNNEEEGESDDENESAAESSDGNRRRKRKKKKKNLCHLVVELMEGGELFDRIIEKRTFTEREARDSIRCVLEALKYMHDRRVVHRDLKPENLLLKLRDKSKLTPVKLADFGFAKSIKSKNGCRSLCGTPGYLAPEILERFPSYDVQCDVWSVGAILFLLLGGYLPFDDDNEEKVFDRTRNAAYDFNPRCWRNISFGAKDLISRCLTLDPRKRFTARDCLNHSWMANKEVARNVQLETDELAARTKGRHKMRAAVKTVSRSFCLTFCLFLAYF